MPQYTYAMTKADGIGEQLRLEILAIPGVPQDGWEVAQNLRTGAISIRYSSDTDLPSPQAVAAVISGHTPDFSQPGDDPPELLLGKVAYGLRRWNSLNATQKDRLEFAVGLLAIRAMGRWE